MKPALVRLTSLTIILSLFVLLGSARPSYAQDVKVREAAEHFLERANRLSTSPHLPNLERIVTFRVSENGAVKNGLVTRVVVQGTGRRDEYTYGNFHLLDVWTPTQVAVVGRQQFFPPEVIKVMRITPIWLVRFDGEDIVHSITDREVNGRAAHCIAFDTIKGEQKENNEICLDAVQETLVLLKAGGELVENSDFFPFAGALIPGSIHYSSSGRTIEITQIMREMTAIGPNVLAAPEGADIHNMCKTARQPFGIWMPQPEAGRGTRLDDIIVRGIVGVDGKMQEFAVQTSDRPELNAEALAFAKQWKFSPAMCDGKPNLREVEITLHFKGR
jgi:TonB family protein